MILISGGDSFIHGNELSDWDPKSLQHSFLTFPSHLAHSRGMLYSCCARPGNSNDAICRMTINRCELLKDETHDKLFVLVAWTFVPRIEFPFEFDIDSPDQPFATISVHSDTNRKAVKEFSKTFFTNVKYWYQHFNTVKSILTMQTYLEFNKIPYMFTMTDNIVLGHINDDQLKPYWKMINFDNWFLFPEAKEPHMTTTPRGFYQWAVENKYQVGPQQHPLDKAHFDAHILMKRKFDELVKKSME